MWTSQVYGHHDKMARTKTHRTSQTRSIQRRNIHKEIKKNNHTFRYDLKIASFEPIILLFCDFKKIHILL